jgi:hypothetical protein
MSIHIIELVTHKQKSESSNFITLVEIFSIQVGAMHVLKVLIGKWGRIIRSTYCIPTCSGIPTSPLAILIFLSSKKVNNFSRMIVQLEKCNQTILKAFLECYRSNFSTTASDQKVPVLHAHNTPLRFHSRRYICTNATVGKWTNSKSQHVTMALVLSSWLGCK